jgi:hypothetical protein
LALFRQKNNMATERQFEANRRNAEKSTGPRTSHGKDSVRMNALRHGLFAQAMVHPGDSPEDFDRHCAGFKSAWKPKNRPEKLLVEKMAIAEWKLARLERTEASLLQNGDPDGARLALFDRLSQYQCRLERTSIRMHKELAILTKAANGRESSKRPRRTPALVWVDGDGNRTVVAPPGDLT